MGICSQEVAAVTVIMLYKPKQACCSHAVLEGLQGHWAVNVPLVLHRIGARGSQPQELSFVHQDPSLETQFLCTGWQLY